MSQVFGDGFTWGANKLDSSKPQSNKPRSWVKLILFAIASMVLLLCLSGALLFREFSPVLYHAEWSNRLNRGFDIWQSNSEQGKSYIEQTFADARAANVPSGTLVGLHRYLLLYPGFKQIFTEYPHDMEARIAFMQLTFMSSDSEDLSSCLDGFQSLVPPVATVKP
jgi:hypothetical protein